MDAFRDHGKLRKSLEENVDAAEGVLARLARSGISLDEVTTQLVDEGVSCSPTRPTRSARSRSSAPSSAATSSSFSRNPMGRRPRRSTKRSPNGPRTARPAGSGAATQLWTGADEDKWLGWLDVCRRAGRHRRRSKVRRQRARAWMAACGAARHGRLQPGAGGADGHVRAAAGLAGIPRARFDRSSQIRAVEAAIDLASTLFIVSRKSGTTLEPNIFKEYFHERVVDTLGADQAGRHFVAVTDPGSALEKAAAADHFADTFFGDADDRRALFGAVGFRHGAGRGHGPRRRAAFGHDAAHGPQLCRDRAARRSIRACGWAWRWAGWRSTRPRQGDDRRFARPTPASAPGSNS